MNNIWEKRKMLRKSITLAFAVLLTLQPLIFTMGMYGGQQSILTDTKAAPAQAPGSRLGPGEYTPHVPILVNSTSDFVAQGWPGDGSAGNPFVISGLNITYSLTVPSIEIRFTDAHFVIRDCLLDRRSSGYALRIWNTSNARVEYTTVISQAGAIYLNNANNTQLSHTYAEGSDSYPLEISHSTDCSVSSSLLNGTSYRSMMAEYAHGLIMSDCELFTPPNWHAFVLQDSNHTSISSVHVHYGVSALRIVRCHYGTVDGFVTHDNRRGFYTSQSSNIVLNQLHGVASVDNGLQVLLSDNMTLSHSYIASDGGYGVYLSDSHDMLVHNVTIGRSVDEGFFVVNCPRLTVNGLESSNTPKIGVYLESCANSTLTNVDVSNTGEQGFVSVDCANLELGYATIQHTGDEGIFVETSFGAAVHHASVYNSTLSGIRVLDSHNSSIIHSSVFLSGLRGIWVGNSDNCTVSDCVVERTHQQGILFEYGQNGWALRNTVSDINSQGLMASLYHDLEIMENSVDSCFSSGISSVASHGGVISHNTVHNTTYGVMLSASHNTTLLHNTISLISQYGIFIPTGNHGSQVHNNTIDGADVFGILLQHNLGVNITHNEFIGCGLVLDLHPSVDSYNYTIHSNTVNGLDLLYLIAENNMAIPGAMYGQIILVACENMTVTGGDFESSSAGIQIHFCNETHISGVKSASDTYAHILHASENITITDVEVVGSDYSMAFFMHESRRISVDNAHIEQVSGLSLTTYLLRSESISFTNSRFEQCLNPIYAESTNNVTIINTEFINSIGRAFHSSSSSDFAHIENSTFIGAEVGIYCVSGAHWRIIRNEFRYCTSDAIYVTPVTSTNGIIMHNTIENCENGIRIFNGNDWLIANNTIRWNAQYGVYLVGSTGTEVYYNILAFNRVANGFDSGAKNWDDGVDTGNWWDDYSGVGVYNVPGGGGSVDNYPNVYAPTTPIIDQPPDISYAEGSTGNTITWYPRDDNFKDWTVHINGELWSSDAFDLIDNIVTVNVDGLPYGVHTVLLTVRDIDLNIATDEVIVTVYDDTPPTLSPEADIVVFVGGTDQMVTWMAYDLNPDVYHVYVDGVLAEEDSWTSGEISLSFDGLTEGIYEYVLQVFDVDGNSASDTIMVKVVNDVIPPTISSPDDLVYPYGSTGNFIVWNVYDQYPASYEVESNGTIVASGTWGGSRIIFNVDGLEVGQYSFTLTVFDRSGQSASDTVNVVVTSIAPVTPPVLFDPTLLMIAGLAAIGVVVVIAGAVHLKKKQQ